MKKVHFVNPNYYADLDQYMSDYEGWVEALSGPFPSPPPVFEGFGQVVEEKGGIVTKVLYKQMMPDGTLLERILDTTTFLITFVSKLNELVATVKIFISSVFGSKKTRQQIRGIKTMRNELNNY